MTNMFPSSEDWIGGSHGIHLLQEYYNLSPSILANGTIQLQNGQTYESDFTMGIEEMYQIGISSLNERYYDTGIEWMEMALKKYQDGNKPNIIVTNDELKDLPRTIESAKTLHDHRLDKAGMISPTHFTTRLTDVL